MGYRTDRTAILELEDMGGAEVRCLIGVPLSAVMEFDLTADADAEWAAFARIAKPEWNLEDADGPIPVDDRMRLPLPVSRAILLGWRNAVVNPPAPLPQPPSEPTP